MALVGVPPPSLPDPPEVITRQYVEDLVRSLEIFISQERNPGELRATKITLTDLPTSSSGLEVGALFNDSGTIKIVT